MAPTPQLTRYGLTYPQCNVPKETALHILQGLEGVKAVVVAQEHPQDGELHLHAYVGFKTRVRRNPEMFTIGPHKPNVQPVNNIRGWIKYLTKEDKMPFTYQFNVRECLRKKSPGMTSTAELADLPIEKLAKKIHPKDLQRTLAGIRLYRALTSEPEELGGPCGYWIAGFAGTGKSTDARRFAGGINERLYTKQRNTWWNEYDGQQVVIMDDPHLEDRGWLTPYLKIWADKFVFDAETEGGAIRMRPKFFIVTANYTLDTFVEHEEDRETLRRRFKQSPWISGFDQAYRWLILETIGMPHLPAETTE